MGLVVHLGELIRSFIVHQIQLVHWTIRMYFSSLVPDCSSSDYWLVISEWNRKSFEYGLVRLTF